MTHAVEFPWSNFFGRRSALNFLVFKRENFIHFINSFSVAKNILKMSQDYSDETGETRAELAATRPKGLLPVRALGNGSYGTVVSFTDDHGQDFARKFFVNKKDCEREKESYIKIKNKSEFIVHFLGADCDVRNGKTFYFIDFELAREGSLLKRIAKFGTDLFYDEDQTVSWLLDILLGLDYLQERLHVTHNDVKPENILLFRKESKIIAKICDLGSAGKPADFNIKDGQKDGPATIGYGAPEIYKEQKVTYASDTWSVGCVAYELIVGFNPFYDLISNLTETDDRDRKIIENILYTDVSKFRFEGVRFLVSDSLQGLILRVLFERNSELRLRASGVLSLGYVKQFLAARNEERLRDKDFRHATADLEKQKLENQRLAADLKSKSQDHLMVITQLRKRTAELQSARNELQQVKKQMMNLAAKPTIDFSAQVNSGTVQDELEDEDDMENKQATLEAFTSLEKHPCLPKFEWALNNTRAVSLRWPSMRLKHVLRFYSLITFTRWMYETGDLILDTAEHLLQHNYYLYVLKRAGTTATGPVPSREVQQLLTIISQCYDADPYSETEIGVLTLLYIILRQPANVYRHFMASTKRTELLVRKKIVSQLDTAVLFAEKVLSANIGAAMLQSIDQEKYAH